MSTQSWLNRPFTVAALALTALLILTALPLASTAAPRLEPEPPESLTALNGTEATESSAPLSVFSAPSAASVVQSPSTTTRISAALRSSPVMFIENVGQFDERARFQVRGGLGTMWLTEDAIWVTVLERPDKGTRGQGDKEQFLPSVHPPTFPSPQRGVNLRLSFPGANPHPRIEPFDRLDTVVSYFIGDDPAKWRPDVPVWGGVRYVALYPGVDLEINSQNGRWTWRLACRANCQFGLQDVRLRVEGADDVALGGDHLRLTTTVGESALSLLQVEGFTMRAEHSNVERLHTHTFDVTFPFTLTDTAVVSRQRLAVVSEDNPTDLLYSTFLGGSNRDVGQAIAVDSDGNAYVVGMTLSTNFPLSNPFQPNPGGVGPRIDDVFVAKLNPTGSALVYSTYLGGRGDDQGLGIAVDSSGNAYVTGDTSSTNFPTTNPLQSGNGGGFDAFVAKLNPTGSALVYSTYLGGRKEDIGYSIAVDADSNTYVTGKTESTNFPTVTPLQRAFGGGNVDAFVAKLNPTGSALVYSTYLGGSGAENIGRGIWTYFGGITVDSDGNAYVTGSTGSTDFPMVNPMQSVFGGGFDAFVAKVNHIDFALSYSTYLGGGGDDFGSGIDVDDSGNTYVTGRTSSTDFPTANPLQSTNGGDSDAFVVKLNPTGSVLVYSTYLGGSGTENGSSFRGNISVDSAGNAYVTGNTSSNNFPTVNPLQGTYGGDFDAFVSKLNPTGSVLVYSTYLGGSGSDVGRGIVVDTARNAYVTGATSTDFPTANPLQPASGGGRDAFVAKLRMEDERPSGLIAYYSFDDGTATDNSGTGHHGTVYGATPVSGVIGNALEFDGVNDYVALSESMAPDYVSVSAWVNTTSNKSGYENVMIVIRLRYWGFKVVLNDVIGKVSGGVAVSRGREYYYLSSESNYNDGNWHHLILTYGAESGFRFYIDGSLKYEDSSLGNTPIYHEPGGGFSIGKDGKHHSDHFQGLIDEIRIYNRALSADEVYELYQQGSGPTPAPSGSLTLLAAPNIPMSHPLEATARVHNTSTLPQEYTLTVRLWQDSTTLSTQIFTLSLASGVVADQTADFGLRPPGRYRVEATLSARGTTVATQSRDITVTDPNVSHIILDYAGDLRVAAHAELDDIADIPSWALADEIMSFGLDELEDKAVSKFADLAAPIQDAGGIPRSTSNDAIAEIRDKLGRAQQYEQNLSIAIRQFVRDMYGVELPTDFDPLNPDLDFITDPILKDRIKKWIAAYLANFFRDNIIGPLWVNSPRSDVDDRHIAFEDFVISHAVTEPPGLAAQMQHGRDRILNVVEGDAIVTLGPYNVLGHTLQYDLTLQEQENKRQLIKKGGPIERILKIALAALIVVAVVVILLLIVGAISSAGTLATVVAPIIWEIVRVLLTVGKILKVATALLVVSMLFTVPLIAPHVPQYHDETLDAAETLIGGSGMARLHSFDVAVQPDQARLTAQVAGPETGQSQVLVETALYSVDGRIINIVWSPLQIQAGQQATLSKDVPLAPGTYRAVTTLYAEGDIAVAEVVPFDVPGPGVELDLSLNQPRLSLGQPVQARVTLTNTDFINSINDLTLIVESTDGENFDAWPVSLGAGETRQINYTFTPAMSGAYVLRAWLGIGLSVLAQQDAAYIIGSGPAIALNTSVSAVYAPGLTVTLPLTLTNVGDSDDTVTVTAQTVDRLEAGVVYSTTLTVPVPAGGTAFAEATALPNAQPGLYSAWLDVNGVPYDSRDFAVSAVDTLFGLLMIGDTYPSVGQNVPVTATVRSADNTPIDASVTVTVQSPAGTATVLPMTWASTGTYRTNYTPAISGTYSLELTVARADYRDVGDQTFFVAGTPTLLVPTVEGQPKVGFIRPLTVTVHSEAGIPVTGVTVVLSGTQEILRDKTDAVGRTVLQTFPPDRRSYVLTADKMGYAGATTQVAVEWHRVYLPIILK